MATSGPHSPAGGQGQGRVGVAAGTSQSQTRARDGSSGSYGNTRIHDQASIEGHAGSVLGWADGSPNDELYWRLPLTPLEESKMYEEDVKWERASLGAWKKQRNNSVSLHRYPGEEEA